MQEGEELNPVCINLHFSDIHLRHVHDNRDYPLCAVGRDDDRRLADDPGVFVHQQVAGPLHHPQPGQLPRQHRLQRGQRARKLRETFRRRSCWHLP